MDGLDVEYSFDASWTMKQMKAELANTIGVDNGSEIVPDDVVVTDLPDVRFLITTEEIPSIEDVLTVLAAENHIAREFMVALQNGREIRDGLTGDGVEFKIRVPIQAPGTPLRDVLVDPDATVAELCDEITAQYGVDGFILVSGGNPLNQTDHLYGLGFPPDLKPTLNLEFVIAETGHRFQSQFLREQTAFFAIEQMRKDYGRVRLESGDDRVQPESPISTLAGALIRIVPDVSFDQRVDQTFRIGGRDIRINLCGDWAIHIARRRIANDVGVSVTDVTFKVNGREVGYFEAMREFTDIPIMVTLPPGTVGPRIACRTPWNPNFFSEAVWPYLTFRELAERFAPDRGDEVQAFQSGRPLDRAIYIHQLSDAPVDLTLPGGPPSIRLQFYPSPQSAMAIHAEFTVGELRDSIAAHWRVGSDTIKLEVGGRELQDWEKVCAVGDTVIRVRLNETITLELEHPNGQRIRQPWNPMCYLSLLEDEAREMYGKEARITQAGKQIGGQMLYWGDLIQGLALKIHAPNRALCPFTVEEKTYRIPFARTDKLRQTRNVLADKGYGRLGEFTVSGNPYSDDATFDSIHNEIWDGVTQNHRIKVSPL